MNFFKWIRWVFSKRLSIIIDSCAFDNVTEKSFYQKNGTFYEYNVRHKVTNCTFKAYKEPEPYVVDVKVEMDIKNGDIYAHYFGDNDVEPIILSDEENKFPFEIVYRSEPVLTEKEKDEIRAERFIDAIYNWNKRDMT